MIRERRITEKDILEQARSGRFELPPVRFKVATAKSRRGKEDFALDAKWKGGTAGFVVETKSLSTPKEFETATGQANSYARTSGALPMVILPYLRESQLRELENRGISGLDLCGNGVVVVPGRLTVF